MSTDNEELIAQIYYSKNEIQQKMKEIKELQSKFSLLEDDNRTNKLLMEKLLYKEEDSPQADDNNQDENIEKKDESPDKNSPRKKNKEDTKKIILLKNEIKILDLEIKHRNLSVEEEKLNNW